MPEDLKLSQIGSSQLPSPFRGLHSPGVRKHGQIIFACYFRKSSIVCGGLNARTGSKNGTTDMLTDPLCTNSEFSRRESHEILQKNVFGNTTHRFLQHVQLFNCERSLWPWFWWWIHLYIQHRQQCDYIIISNELFSVELVSSFEITSRVESSQLPDSIYARANHNAWEAVNRKGNAEYCEKVIWDCEKVPEFLSFLSQQATVEELSHTFNEALVWQWL